MNCTVLVPVEEATWTDAFVTELGRLLDTARHKVVLLHVVPDLTDIHPGDARRRLVQARALLHDCATRLDLPAARTRINVQMGNPRNVIPQQALVAQADMIAMATHVRLGVARLMEGSIAEHVMRVSHCPTLLVHLETPPRRALPAGRRVLVPMDVSIDATEVVDTLCELLDPTGTEVIIYHDDFGTDAEPDAARGHTFIDAQRERLLGEGFRVSLVTPGRAGVAADIAHRLRDLNVDMVAMMTHGRSGLARLMFGSVAESVLHHSTCPLLAISRWPARDLTYREEYFG